MAQKTGTGIGQTNTGIVPASELPKREVPKNPAETFGAVNEVAEPQQAPPETKDELGRSKDPEAPKGQPRHKAGDHRRSGFGTGEEAVKTKDAAEVADEKWMSLGFSGDWTKLSQQTLVGLIVEELRSSSLGFNKRINKCLGELHREELKERAAEARAHEKKAA